MGGSVSATHTYPNSDLTAFFIDAQATQTFWDFQGPGNSGVLNVDGASPVDLAFTTVNIRNDDTFNSSNFLDAALTSTFPGGIAPNDDILIDSWRVVGSTADDSTGFALFMISRDISLYSDLSYQPNAPIGEVDYLAFALFDENTSGGRQFFAVGRVTSISTVPVPAAVWLFGSGLIGLIGVARRKARV